MDVDEAVDSMALDAEHTELQQRMQKFNQVTARTVIRPILSVQRRPCLASSTSL